MQGFSGQLSTMSEQDAKNLAQWLDGEWAQSLNPDPAYTLGAMRPDFAPEPTRYRERPDAVRCGLRALRMIEDDEEFVEAVFNTFDSEPHWLFRTSWTLSTAPMQPKAEPVWLSYDLGGPNRGLVGSRRSDGTGCFTSDQV